MAPIIKNAEPVTTSAQLGSLFQIFTFSLTSIGAEVSDVESAFVINNPKLRLSLQTSIRLLEGKLSDTGSLFQREDWKSGPDCEKKRRILAYLGDYASVFHGQGWNDGSEPPVVLMLQKMPKSLALQVAQHGFGVLPMAAAGVFGNGLYFTNSLAYLNSATPGEDNQVFLMSLVLPGNSFPLSELTLGAGCRPGYQSHFVTVEGSKTGESAGELVIFDPPQALPLFIWTTRGTAQTQVQERASALRKEWNFSLDHTWNSEYLPPLLFFGSWVSADIFCSLGCSSKSEIEHLSSPATGAGQRDMVETTHQFSFAGLENSCG